MAKLKGVIFGQANVLMSEDDHVDGATMNEIARLIAFLRSRGVQPVVLANRDMKVTHGESTKLVRLQDLFDEHVGEFPWYIHAVHKNPEKPKTAAVEYVLQKHGWAPNEVIYVGNTVDDMKSANNGKVLLVNATWFGHHTPYGFQFATPREVARFIATFCLHERDHWGFKIPELDVYALATFSTFKPEFAKYSADARASAKDDDAHVEFWLKYLAASIYFSGLHERIQYVAPFPGHQAGSGNPKLAHVLEVFAKCFKSIGYMEDLLVRHTKSIKSQHNRSLADHANQLNTLHLQERPLRNGKRLVHPPLNKSKTVLVVDDFCTGGHAFEAARALVSATGAKVICVSWLKTINTDYQELAPLAKFNPYVPQVFSKPKVASTHWYSSCVVDKHGKANELNAKLAEYDGWTWPEGI